MSTANIKGGRSVVVHDPSRIMNDQVLADIQYAAIDVNTSGDNVVVTGVADTQIRVLAFWLVCGASTNILWKSGSTQLSGTCPLAANGGVGMESDWGLMITDAGDSLVLNSSATATIGGTVTYVLV